MISQFACGYARSPTLALVSLFMLFFGELPDARAATINVDSNCSLAQAITSANSDSSPGASTCEAGSGADTINLSANVTLSADLPQVTTTMTIQGGGHSIDGGDTYHIFSVTGNGNLTINNATLSDSKANSRSLLSGGAIYVSGGAVTLSKSRITSSSAVNGGGLAASGSGARVTISNSTIDNNSAEDSNNPVGGGLYFVNGATATLSHISLYNNSNSGNSGSGIAVLFTNNVKLRNSIVSDSSAAVDCYTLSSAFAENTGNLIDDNTCSPASNGDPKFGSLTGGPGYYPLQSGSAAIGIGNDAVCATFATDQAGQFARRHGL